MPREIDLPGQIAADAREALSNLRVRQDEINQGSALPSLYAYWHARKNIGKGRQTYEIEKKRVK